MAETDVWPNGMPEVGQTARRSRKVASHDIELFTEISGAQRNQIFGSISRGIELFMLVFLLV